MVAIVDFRFTRGYVLVYGLLVVGASGNGWHLHPRGARGAGLNLTEVPAMPALIVSSAFGCEQAAGYAATARSGTAT